MPHQTTINWGSTQRLGNVSKVFTTLARVSLDDSNEGFTVVIIPDPDLQTTVDALFVQILYGSGSASNKSPIFQLKGRSISIPVPGSYCEVIASVQREAAGSSPARDYSIGAFIARNRAPIQNPGVTSGFNASGNLLFVTKIVEADTPANPQPITAGVGIVTDNLLIPKCARVLHLDMFQSTAGATLRWVDGNGNFIFEELLGSGTSASAAISIPPNALKWTITNAQAGAWNLYNWWTIVL